jgi:ubiquinone/menaquinone biosynthesis C-methylase UbiE
VKAGDTVADVGCGTGLFTFALAEASGPQGKVIAVDHDERSIATIRRRAARDGVETITPAVSSATALEGVSDRSVDFLLSNLVLCCLTDHDSAVAEIQRVLKPSGSAFVSIARWGRRKHPTHVNRDEWRSILKRFRVLSEASRLTQRGAHVSVAV